MRLLETALTLVLALALAACAHRGIPTTENPHDITNGTPVAWDVTGQPVMATRTVSTVEAPSALPGTHEAVVRELKAVYFDYDQASLGAKARADLRENALWLKSHPEAQVLIEGYCDRPGTMEYNLILGEKRAKTVRDFLSALGIGSSRVSIVSYGNSPGIDRKAAVKVVRNE